MIPREPRDLPVLLRAFIIDPIGTMRTPLSLAWSSIFFLTTAAAAFSGATVGISNKSFLDFFVGLIVFPITSLVIALTFSMFIYYYFSFFRSIFLDLRRLISIVTFSLLPFFGFHSVSAFLPPIDLLGFAITALLLIVGLVEQFQLDRRVCVRLISGIGLVFFIIWSISQIHGKIL